ncbi:MAG: winged helix-turn-helix transcriptional regulator [Pseudomonadota bacterium]
MSLDSSELTSNELAVLESLQNTTEAVSQRELARRTGLSVGLINAMLKKLIHTGYVKTSHLNRRTIEYLLTARGFAQTALRSYRYIVSTMRAYREIQRKLHEIVSSLRANGFTEFYLHGDGELAELVTIFFEEEEVGLLRRGIPIKGEALEGKTVVLNTEPVKAKRDGWKVVDLVQEFNGSGQKKDRLHDRKSDSAMAIKHVREFYKGAGRETDDE